MGIKGLYKELGKGKRVALAKLVSDKLEGTGRPLRVAIDVSIWLFQVQSGKGGNNPAIRTLYYRLLRMLALCIQPLFVFDGPDKPPMKRNAKTSASGRNQQLVSKAKELITLFGFQWVTAPGEAEAECALLQVKGIVDAVISDDVDTLMFGGELLLRNLGGEGKSQVITHTHVYSANDIYQELGLDKSGLLLVALMSGGDYFPAGIPGCGVRIACEAARAGFGKELCNVTDSRGRRSWRLRLEHELKTNESGYFRTRHKTLRIPDTFPDEAIMKNYSSPSVSSAAGLEKLKASLSWRLGPDVNGLHRFVGNEFEWRAASGTKKFIRGLAPAFLGWQIMQRSVIPPKGELAQARKPQPRGLKSISGYRRHFEVDGLEQVRVDYMPAEVIGIEYHDKSSHLTLGPDHSKTAGGGELGIIDQYNPNQCDRLWILKGYADRAIPDIVEVWELSQARATGLKSQTRCKTSRQRDQKAIDLYFKPCEPFPGVTTTKKSPESPKKTVPKSPSIISRGSYKTSKIEGARPASKAMDTYFKASKPRLNGNLLDKTDSPGTGHTPSTQDEGRATKRKQNGEGSISQTPEFGTLSSLRYPGTEEQGKASENTAPKSRMAEPQFLHTASKGPKGEMVIKQVQLRESLEGSWQTPDPDADNDVKASKDRRYSRVRAVDLTAET